MGLVTDAILGFQLGFLIIIGVPVFVAPMLHPALRKKIGDYYSHMAMFVMRRAAVARREFGGVDLKVTSNDGNRGSEKMKLGGDRADYEDPYNFMRTFKNRPFGLVLEHKNIYIHPAVAEVAEFRKKQVDKGEHTSYSEEYGKLLTDYVPIPKQTRVVELAHGALLAHGSADPHDSQAAYKEAKESQRLFHQFGDAKKTMMIIIAFVAGYGAVWFGATQGTGGGGVSNPPIPVGTIAPVLKAAIMGVIL